MGPKNVKNSKWRIIVRTGDHKGSGTDSDIFVAFVDEQGKRSKDIKLDVAWRNDFERGKEDKFPCDNLTSNNEMGTPCMMELWKNDSSFWKSKSWYCEVVILQTDSDKLHFPVLRWVETGYRYKFSVNDTSLPQDDQFPDQRKKQLETSRESFKMKVASTLLPVQLEALPQEEQFSDDATRDIQQSRKDTALGILVGKLDFRKMTKYEHMNRLFYIESSFPRPKSSAFWESDESFAAQRLVGLLPTTLKLCEQIPETFDVTDQLVGEFLEGMTLEDAIKQKKLFILDYKLLSGIMPRQGYYICAPLALFFVNSQKKLMPVAIQLYQGKQNPVFTPAIDRHKWNLAKMWFNLSESAFHQICYHLGFTHLAMEGIVIAVHRCLAKNHPLFRLLAPHFLFLLAIKFRGLDLLICEDGLVNKVMSIGVKGGMQLLARLWSDWTLDITATLPAELKERGVDDSSTLPDYPYRDDGLLVYNAIKKYVTDIVNIYYDSDNKIANDQELHDWGKLLSIAAAEGGIGIKDPITEEDVMGYMEDKETMYATLALAKILSTNSTNALGDWEIRWQYDPRAIEVENRFRDDLRAVSEKIKKRNLERNEIYKYTIMDPENIPNAISI